MSVEREGRQAAAYLERILTRLQREDLQAEAVELRGSAKLGRAIEDLETARANLATVIRDLRILEGS